MLAVPYLCYLCSYEEMTGGSTECQKESGIIIAFLSASLRSLIG